MLDRDCLHARARAYAHSPGRPETLSFAARACSLQTVARARAVWTLAGRVRPRSRDAASSRGGARLVESVAVGRGYTEACLRPLYTGLGVTLEQQCGHLVAMAGIC